MTLQTTEQWESWFIQAGIQPEYAMQYATHFVINRINEHCLSGISEHFLNKLRITSIGDMICILNAAKRHTESLASSASASQSAPTISHHHAEHMGASSSYHHTVTPPRVNTGMTLPQFHKFESDWRVYKQFTNMPDNLISTQLYNCCDNFIRYHITYLAPKFFNLDEETIITYLRDIVTKHSNPTVEQAPNLHHCPPHAENSIRNQTSTSFDGGQFNGNVINSNTGETKNITNNYFPKDSTIAKRPRLDSKDSDLRSFLNKNAQIESGKFTSPINPQLSTKLNPVPLKMTSNMDRSLAHLDDEGHYNTRSDFKKILKSRRGDLTLEQLFEKANEQAKANAKSQTNEEAKAKYVQLHGNTVTLLGQAGIGKTTLARKMLKLILDGKLFPGTQYLFFIPIRKLNVDDELTFLQFALIGCSEHWHHDPETDKLLLEKLCNEQNIVFIFDGLDEGNTDQLREKVVGVLGDKAKPHVFLRKILCGDFLPHSKKVVTSRPRQFFELHSDCRIGLVVDILGLNTDGRNKLCEQICGKNNMLVKQYLDEHPDVSASCYVPVKCIIILLVLSKAISKSGDIDIQSLTDIFVQALGYYVTSPHVGDYAGEVWKLADLAWLGFLKKKIIFDKSDFKSANISSQAFGSFLETFVDSSTFQYNILEGDKKSSFSHLVWQELFAATNLMVLMPACVFESYLNQLNDSAWEVVAVFMFGFLNQSVMQKIKKILSKGDIAIEEWEKKKELLKNHLLDMARSAGHRRNNPKLLRLCSWIHEANSDELNKEVLPHLPETLQLGEEKIYPTDVSDIIYVLSKANRSFSLRLENTNLKLVRRKLTHNLTGGTFKRLCKGLSGLSLKMKKVEICDYKLSDDGAKSLAACLHNIEVLYVSKCEITNIGIEEIARNLSKLNKPMKKVEICDYKLSDEWAKSLAACLHNIEVLDVSKCGITNIGIEEIARNLSKLNKPIKQLHLSDNKFGDDGAKSLAASLHNIEVLNVIGCGITNIGMEEIASNLVKLNKPIKQLDLRGNKFGDDGAKSLAACLHNIEVLNVSNCEITNIGMEEIARNLEKLNKPINQLNLGLNMLGDDGAKSLAASLHNIEVLNVSQCEITNIAIEEIASNLVKLNKPMKKLTLSDNKLCDDGAKSLAACLHNIEVLDVYYCALGDVGVEAIKNKLATLDQSKHEVDGLDIQF